MEIILIMHETESLSELREGKITLRMQEKWTSTTWLFKISRENRSAPDAHTSGARTHPSKILSTAQDLITFRQTLKQLLLAKVRKVLAYTQYSSNHLILLLVASNYDFKYSYLSLRWG